VKGANHTRIIETTDDAVAVKLFDLELYDPADPPGRVAAYRSERIPSLYPTVFPKAPNGVGNTLTIDKVGGAETLSWAASQPDTNHDAAGYYVIYSSTSPDADFSIEETSESTEVDAADGPALLVYYKLVAANLAGTSGDEPPTD
jgi:hypothetical protein